MSLRTVLALPNQRGINEPLSPFQAMRLGDDVMVITQNTTYAVVRAKRGFVVISSNKEMAYGQFFSMDGIGKPAIGQRWDWAGGLTSTVRQIIVS